MNTEIKTDKKSEYTFEGMVKQTERSILKGYKQIKSVPTMVHIAIQEGKDTNYGVGFIPDNTGASNGELLETLGNNLATEGKQVKAVGVICEAYMSNRKDIRPSADPKHKEVLVMAFGDSNGNKKVLLYSANKGKAKKMVGMMGMKGVAFQGLVDDFWKGYTAKPKINGSAVQTNLC